MKESLIGGGFEIRNYITHEQGYSIYGEQCKTTTFEILLYFIRPRLTSRSVVSYYPTLSSWWVVEKFLRDVLPTELSASFNEVIRKPRTDENHWQSERAKGKRRTKEPKASREQRVIWRPRVFRKPRATKGTKR